MNETTPATAPRDIDTKTPIKQVRAKNIKVGMYMPTSLYVAPAISAVRADDDGEYLISYEVKSPIKYDKNGDMMFKLKTITTIWAANDTLPIVK